MSGYECVGIALMSFAVGAYVGIYLCERKSKEGGEK